MQASVLGPASVDVVCGGSRARGNCMIAPRLPDGRGSLLPLRSIPVPSFKLSTRIKWNSFKTVLKLFYFSVISIVRTVLKTGLPRGMPPDDYDDDADDGDNDDTWMLLFEHQRRWRLSCVVRTYRNWSTAEMRRQSNVPHLSTRNRAASSPAAAAASRRQRIRRLCCPYVSCTRWLYSPFN